MKQRTALITGGASGIGRAVVDAALARGAHVIVVDRDQGALDALVAGLSHVRAFACDVTDTEALADVVRDATGDSGPPTAVFANAGIEVNARVDRMPDAEWHRVLDVNLTGVFHTIRATSRALVEAGMPGSIVATSSPAAFVGFAGGGNSAYAASKGGISALVRAAALDLAPHGIRVNAVVPGATDTPMMLSGGASAATVAKRAAAEIPLARLARPSEIAAAVLWLLSDEASYVTGSHVVVDGGLMAKSANTI